MRPPGHLTALEVIEASSTADLATFKFEEGSRLVTLQALQRAVATIEDLADKGQRVGFAIP